MIFVCGNIYLLSVVRVVDLCGNISSQCMVRVEIVG